MFLRVQFLLIVITSVVLFVKCQLDIFGTYDFDQVHSLSMIQTVEPYLIESVKLKKKYLTENLFFEEPAITKSLKIGNWIIDFDDFENEYSMLLHPEIEVSYIDENADKISTRFNKNCEYKSGKVRGFEQSSNAAITICDKEILGYLKIKEETYFIEPSNITETEHIIYKRSTDEPDNNPKKWDYFNLTGDVIDLEDENPSENFDIPKENYTESDFHEENVTIINLEQKNTNDDELGYFVDSVWESKLTAPKQTKGKPTLPPMWLEIALAVDHTVINFHGRDRVQRYVLSLMNIVNAIYQDPSLDVQIQLVITRLHFYESKKSTVIRLGDARKSLQNVNAWNRRLHISLAPGEPQHDVAVWLTRADIGGPSGYAPVAGACDPKRSCTLNRDEGLTSGFIIAHEIAHVLGLTHDGEQKSGNNCGSDSYYGSVMAPVVTSTFYKFTWSVCSKNEFHTKTSKFKCLLNRPVQVSQELILNNTLQATFTMDEQCRMEFGDGYSLCRSFDIIEICSHLWCSHVDSPQVCKTKKGSPIEGTDCGFDKWCINGYCEQVDKSRFGRNPIHHNPQNGRWSSWSTWGFCSRTCGIGVQFRSRKCDNPPPMYGGNNCFGTPEEWKLCNLGPCLEPLRDARAQQCSNLAKYVDFGNSSKRNMIWLPFESDEHELKCKLICISKETRELYITDENLIDGTLCSYDSSTEICIQGTCHHVGCDEKLFSNARPDSCGICNGNNSDCINVKSSIHRKLKKELSRIKVIPKTARSITFEANITSDYVKPNVAFMLKDRNLQSYSVTVPNTGAHGEIISGTKFHYMKFSNRHVISANGPLLSEIIIYIFVPKSVIERGASIYYSTDYYIHKDFEDTPKNYQWIVGGWGPCSKSCGGGTRYKTTACFDTKTNRIVPRKHCSLLSKPQSQNEKCNQYSCNFHWVPGSWEPCTRTCGSFGIQSRELHCFPSHVLNNTELGENSIDYPWRYMVSPSKCGGNPPASTKHCNRIPCPSFWKFGNWSQCSASCGSGVSIRNSHCPAPGDELFFSCGQFPPQQKKVCRGPYNRYNNPSCKVKGKKFNCVRDQSKYCNLLPLRKYCNWGFFKRHCCKTCLQYKLQQTTT